MVILAGEHKVEKSRVLNYIKRNTKILIIPGELAICGEDCVDHE